MNAFKQLRDGYIISHVNHIKFPIVTSSNIIRKKVTFSGRVQMVGFRFEIYCIAERMKLTGWVKNLEDGSVETELQGEESQIYFLVNNMKSLKRAYVKNMTMRDVPISAGEKNFTILR
ncbi:MAG TPA: acylphosphatase [Clostridium sp.]|uniref:acylphosphatase n=1 Tax=Clostridium sp. TaxID=1506 RepID=UPI002F924FD1